MHTFFSWNRLILMHHQRHSYSWPHSKHTHRKKNTEYACVKRWNMLWIWLIWHWKRSRLSLEQMSLEKCKNRNAVRNVRSMIHPHPLPYSSVHGDTATCFPPHLHARPTTLEHTWRPQHSKKNCSPKTSFFCIKKNSFQGTIRSFLKQIQVSFSHSKHAMITILILKS